MARPLAADIDDRLRRLEGLARAYAKASATARREAAVAYLFELAEFVASRTDSETAIAPLLDVIPFVSNPIESQLFGERRSTLSHPSSALLARTSAAIDVLAHLGETPEAAAQFIARQMINARVRLPDEGDDPRGWRRLLTWRDRLVEEAGTSAEHAIYVALMTELDRLPRAQLRVLAADGRIWNSRAWK